MSDITLSGDERVLDALRRFTTEAKTVFSAATEQSLLTMVRDAADYPAAPPNSRYRRTGTLGRTWTAARPAFAAQTTGFEGTLANTTPYGPFVQGERQARVHAGRWKTVRQIETQNRSQVEARFQAAIAKLEQELQR